MWFSFRIRLTRWENQHYVERNFTKMAWLRDHRASTRHSLEVQIVAKGVRSSWANGRPQELPVTPDDFKDSAAGKRAEGAAQRQKDLAKYCARSYLSKVTQDGDGNSSAQREGLGAASLAAPQVETVVFPVDVFEAKRADFT